MRAAIKSTSAAEMVYGSTLRLPGEFISPMDQPNPDEATGDVRQLKKNDAVTPTYSNEEIQETPLQRAELSLLHPRLRSQDTVHKALQALYDGHFPVLQRHANAFNIERKGKRDSVTIDRLKAAFLDSDVSRRPCDVAAPNQQTSNASSHHQRSARKLSEPESTAGRSSRSSSASTRPPISVDGHRSAKIVFRSTTRADLQMNARVGDAPPVVAPFLLLLLLARDIETNPASVSPTHTRLRD